MNSQGGCEWIDARRPAIEIRAGRDPHCGAPVLPGSCYCAAHYYRAHVNVQPGATIPEMTATARAIKRERERRHWLYGDLARRLGVRRDSVWKLEHGAMAVTPVLRARLQAVLGPLP